MTEQTDQLHERLAALRKVRDLLDDTAELDQKIADLATRLAEPEGDAWVSVPGDSGEDRSFHGRDLRGSAVVTGDGNIVTQMIDQDAPPETLLALYFDQIAAECRRLPLDVIDAQFIEQSGTGVRLNDVYVNLDARPLERMPGESREGASERTPLLHILEREKRLVLLGAPGSGKSTFVNYLAGHLAGAFGSRPSKPADAVPDGLCRLLPLRLLLRETAARYLPRNAPRGEAKHLWSAIRGDIQDVLGSEEAAERAFVRLRMQIEEHGAILFLDGLDEAPVKDRRRQRILEAVQDLTNRLSNSRFVVTARPYAYRKTVLSGFQVTHLLPLNREQQAVFVAGWYRAMQRHQGISAASAEVRRARLMLALERLPHLGRLAERPLLLTLMATLHSTSGDLPEDRAALYDQSVGLLLKGWLQRRLGYDAEGRLIAEEGIGQLLETHLGELRTTLARLALQVHSRQREEDASGDEPADIRKGDILEVFQSLTDRCEGGARALLDYLNHHAGLLVADDQDGPYRFYHRSFQEYLAAESICSRGGYTKRLRDLVEQDYDWWREVYLLAAGVIGPGNWVDLLQRLIPCDFPSKESPRPIRLRCAALAAEVLLEQRVPAAVGRLRQEPAPDRGEIQDLEGLMDRVRGWLAGWLQSNALEPAARAEAGDLLGRLGDPRSGIGLNRDGLPQIDWIPIPGGEVSVEGVVETVAPFEVARYPVTVAQFAAFLDEGGYAERAYWTEVGWAWRTGELDDWKDAKDWAWLLGARAKGTDRERPMSWDSQQAFPNRPVVAVNWWEALAFCRWFSQRNGRRASLPTEAQWVRAAAGEDGREHPWGPWEGNRANTKEAGIGHASPVGCFPLGETPEGVSDLAGNCWEWTLSGPPGNNLDAKGSRIRKGGSFGNSEKFARCSYRRGYSPGDFGDSLGFRLYFSPALS